MSGSQQGCRVIQSGEGEGEGGCPPCAPAASPCHSMPSFPASTMTTSSAPPPHRLILEGMQTLLHAHARTHSCTHTRARTHALVHAHACTHPRTHPRTHTHACMHARAHVHDTRSRMHTHTHTHTLFLSHTRACAHTHTHTHMRTHTHTHSTLLCAGELYVDAAHVAGQGHDDRARAVPPGVRGDVEVSIAVVLVCLFAVVWSSCCA